MKKILTAIVLGSLLTALVLPAVALAQDAPANECTIRQTFEFEGVTYTKGHVVSDSVANWGIVCMFNTIYSATNWLFMILVLLSVLFIIVGGFTYITASGDPEKAGKGGKIIVYALIGLAIALFAKVIPSIVRFIMGL